MIEHAKRWAFPGTAILLLAGGLIYAFWPQPVPVDLGPAQSGPMLVTIDDDGETRVRDVYVVSAPLGGRMQRLQGNVGDEVIAGKTILVTIQPTEPTFHDARTHSELQSAVKAAEAARALAAAELARLEATRDFAAQEFRRTSVLAERGTVSQSALDRARMEMRTQDARVLTAQAALEVRAYELQTAQAALLDPGAARAASDPESCCFKVYAPVSGTILRVIQESEAVVAPGAPLIEIGDPADLEIVVDLLSTDAVQISPGADVLIDSWGGAGSLNGRVRRVEPFGFTKISALGIEEQRVNVIVDFTGPPERRARLGHGYRVVTRLVLWRGEQVLQVPLSTLFRDAQGDWALFRSVDGHAQLTKVEIGHMNSRVAEILSGISDGDLLILHPSDRVIDGVKVTAR